ncbi:MAG: hypothetical protein IAF94_06140 [Pirellulaceae bacterium]|nr:hypothetical protein [Pirellulaceae bacterium]
MAKKTTSVDRSDPYKNKSLAIRNVLGKIPDAKVSVVAAAVKKDYGHDVSRPMIYMIKTKNNMASDGRVKKKRTKRSDTPMISAALWVEAIKLARQLLKATGSVANATALLKAVDG